MEGTLTNNIAFQRLTSQNSIDTKDLIQEVVKRADGVFLWVMLVVRSLLHGIRNRDSIADLQERLEKLPRELEPLYDHLLNRIGPEYLRWASMAFQVLNTMKSHIEDNTESLLNPFGLEPYKSFNFNIKDLMPVAPFTDLQINMADFPLFFFYLALDERLELPVVKNWSMRMMVSKCQDAERHLAARCGGLVEVWYKKSRNGSDLDSRIKYLHRTVEEYLHRPDRWAVIIARTKDTFDANLALVKACVLLLGAGLNRLLCPAPDYKKVAFQTLFHTYCAEGSAKPIPRQLLDDFNEVMTSRHRGLVPLRQSHWSIDYTKDNGIATVEPVTSFLQVAVLMGLGSYVAAVLEDGVKPIKGNSDLLYYAIYSIWPQISIVKLLLQNGYSPNNVRGDKTYWQYSLDYWQAMYLLNEQMDNPGILNKNKCYIFEIWIAMLDAGADPRTSVSFSATNKTEPFNVRYILDSTGSSWDDRWRKRYATEAAALREAVERTEKRQAHEPATISEAQQTDPGQAKRASKRESAKAFLKNLMKR